MSSDHDNNGKAIKVNVWINEERLEALANAGMAELANEAFAGMKLLEIHTTEEQKNVVLQRFPGRSTTRPPPGPSSCCPSRPRTGCWSCRSRCIPPAPT